MTLTCCTILLLLLCDLTTGSPIKSTTTGLVKRYTGNISGQEDPAPDAPVTSDFPNDNTINDNLASTAGVRA